MSIKKNLQKGFTLIEMIVSLGVFSIVITVAVGALLVLIGTNQQLQSEQSVMTNLTFVLDSMTREIRTGTFFYCDVATNYNQYGPNTVFDGGNDIDAIRSTTSVRDCSNGNNSGRDLHGISFVESGDSITGAGATRILYFFDGSSDPTGGKLYRKIGAEDPQSIVSSGIFIRNAEFFVTGSKPLSAGSPDNADQASVTIFIEASEVDDPTEKVYYVQTTVTQRTLDI